MESGRSLISFLLGGIVTLLIVATIFFHLYTNKVIEENVKNQINNTIGNEIVEETDEKKENLVDNEKQEENLVDNEEQEENNNQEENDFQNDETTIINNGDYFVKYNNDIYYWKLNEESRKKSALFAIFKMVETEANELIKRDADGNEEVIFKGGGHGPIYISNKKIYATEVIDDIGEKRVFSIELDNKNKEDICNGEIKFFEEDYLIVQSEDAEIIKIDTKTNESEVLKNNAAFLGILDNKIYYLSTNSEKYSNLSRLGDTEIKIGVLTENQDQGVIATFDKEIFEYYSENSDIIVDKFRTENNTIKFYLTYLGGSASVEQEKVAISMDKNGNVLGQERLTMIEGGGFENEYSEIKLVETKYADGKTQVTYKGNEIFLEEDIMERYNLENTDEHLFNMTSSSVIEDDIYFMYDYSKYSEEASIGWRYGYERIETIVFKYNTNTKEITNIYNF